MHRTLESVQLCLSPLSAQGCHVVPAAHTLSLASLLTELCKASWLEVAVKSQVKVCLPTPWVDEVSLGREA